ncbi:hypothetical protein ACET3Z_014242 [Daucus carota]
MLCAKGITSDQVILSFAAGHDFSSGGFGEGIVIICDQKPGRLIKFMMVMMISFFQLKFHILLLLSFLIPFGVPSLCLLFKNSSPKDAGLEGLIPLMKKHRVEMRTMILAFKSPKRKGDYS